MKRFLSILLIPALVSASDILSDLEQRNKEDTSKSGGSETEMQIVQQFWGNPHFMRQCLPPGSSIPEPFVIYIDLIDGHTNRIAFSKNSTVTSCIYQNVKDKTYQISHKRFVAKIDMKFSE